MSKFALLCQAARLLGQVLNHVSGDSSHDIELWIQLDRTVYSMLEASVNVENPDCDRIAFIYRYSHFSCPSLYTAPAIMSD